MTPQFKKQTGMETQIKKEKGTQQQIGTIKNVIMQKFKKKKCELHFDIVFCFFFRGETFSAFDAASASNAWKCLWDGRNSEGDTLTLNTVENLSLNLLCSVFFFRDVEPMQFVYR